MAAPFDPPLGPALWAKARGLDHPYPAGCHSLDAGVMAGAVWDHYLTARQRHTIASGWGLPQRAARRLVMFLAALHDLGKITPGFQACAPAADQVTGQPGYPPADPAAGRLSHQRAVHLALPELLHRRYGLSLTGRPTKAVAHQLGQILSGHHGTYGTALSHQGNELTCPLTAVPALGDDAWDRDREALLALAEATFGTPAFPNQVAPAPAAVITTGLITLADWLVSQLDWVRARQRSWDTDGTHTWTAHVHRARRAARQALRDAQLVTPHWRTLTSFEGMFPHLSAYPPHPLQTSLAEHLPGLVRGPGLLLITAPPGEGKTEAALFSERLMGPAAGTNGLAFLLPTMATTDAMWQRVRDHTRTNCHTPPPVTLLHSLAWLDAAYTPDDLHTTTCDPDTVAEWLRGRYRGLLAGIAVGTWDQAALAALPHRHLAMRWLGLSGKTVIIDEVHAYDAHGHALTLRLLQWLGALGAPVILLSATVTGTTAAALVHAYRTGAGHTNTPPLTPNYPGWTHIDHTTGTITTSPPLHSNRAHSLTIESHPVTHTHHPNQPAGRPHTILNLLTPLATTHTGCALIVCNTVADAQTTHDLLAAAWQHQDASPLVRILHARMPARQRQAITRRLQRWTGPRGQRPTRPFVVIATQVAEQSLDVDFDLVISDLAPLALLLQRAGRGHRHPRTDRPTWAPTGQPRLAVLIPTGTLPPKHWGEVYSASLLRRTRDLLHTLAATPLQVPHDVQRCVDDVYGPEFAGTDDMARIADDMARASIADLTAIPPPATTRDLHPLTNTDQHPDLIATRLGADGIRILPTYMTSDGHHWLHPTHHTPQTALPHHIAPDDVSTIRRLMNATIPINSQWLQGRTPNTNPPTTWTKVPALRDVILLPHTTTDDHIAPYHAGKRTIHLDPENGLMRH
ncbi:CRISPR-associated helicase Cas3' [Streptomyces sp. NPDC006733]|uniref:CRISPR-associated helicase Cas3' n=1 Tax=Streptomyces sp. NPDC006733 TaxID=3155460 RepID=UPI0033C215AA